MKILAVTSCPSGVAHTYMAAEALEREAKTRGIEIKVETQGSIGIENKIAAKDLKDADIVILTNDVAIKEAERFKDLPVVKVGVSDVVKKTGNILDRIEVYVKSKRK